jgi:hypothetical protein
MLPRPRDFTGAVYKIRTTASGQIPTDADLQRAIRRRLARLRDAGVEGPAAAGDRKDVLAYIKTFSAFFADTSSARLPS